MSFINQVQELEVTITFSLVVRGKGFFCIKIPCSKKKGLVWGTLFITTLESKTLEVLPLITPLCF